MLSLACLLVLIRFMADPPRIFGVTLQVRRGIGGHPENLRRNLRGRIDAGTPTSFKVSVVEMCDRRLILRHLGIKGSRVPQSPVIHILIIKCWEGLYS